MKGNVLKVLLVGPYPPPFGGISVHVRNAQSLLMQAGVQCALLNIAKGAPAANGVTFGWELLKHACKGWTIHVHTNGHNPKSWLIALAGGMASRVGAGGVLTLHSGGVPEYLRTAGPVGRTISRVACRLYNRVVCVNQEQAQDIAELGVSPRNLSVLPAYLPTPSCAVAVPERIERWLSRRRPVVSTALFFRPEYGFELLMDAIAEVRRRHSDIGCLVMGSRLGAEEAEELVRSKGLEDAVLIAGDLDHDLCLTLMARSDLFVRATYQDGDSISVREALALGVPVIASNVGNRPPRVTLFQAGNANELIGCIGQFLSSDARKITAAELPTDSGRQLAALYQFREIAG